MLSCRLLLTILKNCDLLYSILQMLSEVVDHLNAFRVDVSTMRVRTL